MYSLRYRRTSRVEILRSRQGLQRPRAAPCLIPADSGGLGVTPERNEETAGGQRQCDFVPYPRRTQYISCDEKERVTNSLEQRTATRKILSESIDGRRGASVPQCGHRTITLKQRQLCAERL